jgi:hypothetical protein
LLAALIASAGAQEFPAWTEPAKAGPDFLVQGEYVGLVGGSHAIAFDAAEFDSQGRKHRPAMMTVRHNGVMVFDKYVMPTVPPGGSPDQSLEKEARPIVLQAHGNPVHFRNVWVREK